MHYVFVNGAWCLTMTRPQLTGFGQSSSMMHLGLAKLIHKLPVLVPSPPPSALSIKTTKVTHHACECRCILAWAGYRIIVGLQ